MRISIFVAIAAWRILAVQGANIVMSNDDGWAEINIRTFFNTLRAAGENPVLSAPAENESGEGECRCSCTSQTVRLTSDQGSRTDSPHTLSQSCEFDSCPAGSPGYGFNASEPRLNYVNSFPVPAMNHGIKNVAPKFFSGSGPDMAVSGFNVGINTGIATYFSGTVGAAGEAVDLGIPAIAFSAATGQQTSWDSPTPLYAQVYADLATNLTQTILGSGKPYLPSGSFLNVNFGPVSDTECRSPYDFKYVMTRIHHARLPRSDTEHCGSRRLPTEKDIISQAGCWVSISVGVAKTKGDDYGAQPAVLAKLKDILTCPPKEHEDKSPKQQHHHHSHSDDAHK